MNAMFDIPCTEAAVQMLHNFIEIARRHGCSPVNFLHILRTPFLFSRTPLDYCFCLQFLIKCKVFNSIINSTAEKIGFSCTNCFRPLVLLVFALATALSKFRFRSLRSKIINLVLID